MFCFWWFVCGLRSLACRLVAALNFSIKVPARPDLIFKTQSGSDRKKMFDWFKPNQAKPKTEWSQVKADKPLQAKKVIDKCDSLKAVLQFDRWIGIGDQRKCVIDSDTSQIRQTERVWYLFKVFCKVKSFLAIPRNLSETFVSVQTFPIWINFWSSEKEKSLKYYSFIHCGVIDLIQKFILI